MRILMKFLLLAITITTAGIFFAHIALGAFTYTFQPPQTITVTMYRLDRDTGQKIFPDKLCESQDPNYGCTADSNLGTYPFGNVTTITVQIEGTAVNNRYLRDVVAQEMSPANFEPSAIRAQVIAARTYAYWHIQAGSQIDNSVNKQAFIPRTYDTFNAQQKAIIDVAMVGRHYMSVESSDLPVFSEFSSDAFLQTKPGDYAYLKSVSDPISYDPAIPIAIATDQAHQRGLSQKGAGRWANGTSSYRQGQGDPWPVAWDDRRQILTHYYTGIHIRDGDNANALQTPQYRWLPLWLSRIDSSAASVSFCSGGPNAFSVWVQNSGVQSWTPSSQQNFALGVKSGPTWATASISHDLASAVAPGDTITRTLTLYPPAGVTGSYAISLDMYSFSPNTPNVKNWFGNSEPQPRTWPTLDLQVSVIGPCRYSFLPAVQTGGVTQ